MCDKKTSVCILVMLGKKPAQAEFHVCGFMKFYKWATLQEFVRRIFYFHFFLIRIEICFVRLTCQIHMYQVDLTTICHMDNKTGFVVLFFDMRLMYTRDCTSISQSIFHDYFCWSLSRIYNYSSTQCCHKGYMNTYALFCIYYQNH